MSSLSPIEHKVSIIAKDLDTAFEAFARHSSQIANFRGWQLTLFLAYLGFMISIKSDNLLIIVPYGFIAILFMYLEGDEKQWMDLELKEIRAVEQIFMEEDPVKFTELIRQYVFRDIRLHEFQLSFWRWQIRRIKFMLSSSALVWHLLLILLLVFTHAAITLRIF